MSELELHDRVIARWRARLLQQVIDGVSDGTFEIRRRRRDLVGVEAAGLIQQNDVGKGAADVGGDAYSVRR